MDKYAVCPQRSSPGTPGQNPAGGQTAGNRGHTRAKARPGTYRTASRLWQAAQWPGLTSRNAGHSAAHCSVA